MRTQFREVQQSLQNFLQSTVMEEVTKQMTELSTAQKDKVEELNSEIRKLKAMIVKHETRIR